MDGWIGGMILRSNAMRGILHTYIAVCCSHNVMSEVALVYLPLHMCIPIYEAQTPWQFEVGVAIKCTNVPISKLHQYVQIVFSHTRQ